MALEILISVDVPMCQFSQTVFKNDTISVDKKQEVGRGGEQKERVRFIPCFSFHNKKIYKLPTNPFLQRPTAKNERPHSMDISGRSGHCLVERDNAWSFIIRYLTMPHSGLYWAIFKSETPRK